MLPTGELAVLATPMGSGAPPNRLHLVGPEGRLLASFAPAPRAYDRLNDSNERAGSLSPSARYGGLWLATLSRYALQLYVEQDVRRIVLRELDWFRPWEGRVALEGLASPSRPGIVGVGERPDGLLTVLLRRADANWEENQHLFSRFAASSSGEGATNPRAVDRTLMFDSVLEILDVETGRIVGSSASSDYLRGPIGDGTIVYARRYDIIGRVYIHLFRVALPDGPGARESYVS